MEPVAVVDALGGYHTDMGVDRLGLRKVFESIVAQRRGGVVGEHHVFAVFLQRSRGGAYYLGCRVDEGEQQEREQCRVEFIHRIVGISKYDYDTKLLKKIIPANF